MKSKQNKYGLTLVEILVAIAIVAVLAAGLYSVSNYVEKQAKIELTKSTIEILCAALEQYHDFYGKFPFEADKDYGQSELEPNVGGKIADKACVVSAVDYNDIYSSSEALYYFLNQFSAGRSVVSSINRSLLTNRGEKGKEYFIMLNIDGKCYPLIHIIDPWKYPLRYTYGQGDNFPVITSAGPDKDFNSPTDNISSRQ